MLLLLRGDAMQEVGGLSDALTNGQTNDQTTSKEDGEGGALSSFDHHQPLVSRSSRV